MRALLLLIAGLISYGSLYPFEINPGMPSAAQIRNLITDVELAASPANIIANLLLFMPYGFVAVLALRRHVHRALALVLYVLLGTTLAVALQVAQMWLPGRIPTLGDALINLVGIVLGMLLAAPVQRLQPAATPKSFNGLALAAGGLAAAWITYRWFPVVPTIDFQNIKNAFKPLFLEPHFRPLRAAHDMVAWLAFFRLLAFTPLKRFSLPLLACGAVCILLITPLKVGGTLHPHNVVGLMLAIAAMPLLKRHDASTLIAGALFVIVLLTGLMPYQLAVPPNDFKWIPFTGFLGGSMETNLLNLFYKCFIYGTLVFLLRDCGARPIAGAMTVAVWLGMIEFAQIWLSGRTAEITDPILALLLAVVLHLLIREDSLMHTGNRREAPASPRMAPKSSKDMP